MKYNVRSVNFPQDFKYIEVIKKGKNKHIKNDAFYLKHPPMDLSRRAKIFAPFDALKGFNEAIEEKNVDDIIDIERSPFDENDIC
ncbi:MAG: hypothetical protein K6G76_10620 [Lachnospiraceae bacterium]|nr:hypothetical protein [Lachnospiraceae bacterium]